MELLSVLDTKKYPQACFPVDVKEISASSPVDVYSVPNNNNNLIYSVQKLQNKTFCALYNYEKYCYMKD